MTFLDDTKGRASNVSTIPMIEPGIGSRRPLLNKSPAKVKAKMIPS